MRSCIGVVSAEIALVWLGWIYLTENLSVYGKLPGTLTIYTLLCAKTKHCELQHALKLVSAMPQQAQLVSK